MENVTFKIGELVKTPYGEGIIKDIQGDKFLVLHDPNPCQVNECWLEEYELD